MIPAKLKPLYSAAKKARLQAHAPHSGHRVGAAVRLRNGKIFPGCNVENSSYGATVCAERGAIQTAVCSEGKIRIAEVLVVTDATPPWVPCGLCRQVLSEFGDDFVIHATNLNGDLVSMPFRELNPASFTATELRTGKKSKSGK